RELRATRGIGCRLTEGRSAAGVDDGTTAHCEPLNRLVGHEVHENQAQLELRGCRRRPDDRAKTRPTSDTEPRTAPRPTLAERSRGARPCGMFLCATLGTGNVARGACLDARARQTAVERARARIRLWATRLCALSDRLALDARNWDTSA